MALKRNLLVVVAVNVACYLVPVMALYLSEPTHHKPYEEPAPQQIIWAALLRVSGPISAIIYTLIGARRITIRDDYLSTILLLVLHFMFLSFALIIIRFTVFSPFTVFGPSFD